MDDMPRAHRHEVAHTHCELDGPDDGEVPGSDGEAAMLGDRSTVTPPSLPLLLLIRTSCPRGGRTRAKSESPEALAVALAAAPGSHCPALHFALRVAGNWKDSRKQVAVAGPFMSSLWHHVVMPLVSRGMWHMALCPELAPANGERPGGVAAAPRAPRPAGFWPLVAPLAHPPASPAPGCWRGKR
jgi:hypothetical protein